MINIKEDTNQWKVPVCSSRREHRPWEADNRLARLASENELENYNFLRLEDNEGEVVDRVIIVCRKGVEVRRCSLEETPDKHRLMDVSQFEKSQRKEQGQTDEHLGCKILSGENWLHLVSKTEGRDDLALSLLIQGYNNDANGILNVFTERRTKPSGSTGRMLSLDPEECLLIFAEEDNSLTAKKASGEVMDKYNIWQRVKGVLE